MISVSNTVHLHAKFSAYQKVHFTIKVALFLEKATVFFFIKDLTYNMNMYSRFILGQYYSLSLPLQISDLISDDDFL